jgi:hypothetical protein
LLYIRDYVYHYSAHWSSLRNAVHANVKNVIYQL